MKSDTSGNRTLLAIAAVAFLLRFAIGWLLRADSFFEDGYTFFFELARSLSSGHGLAADDGAPTAFRVPIYSAFLALLTQGHDWPAPVILAQSLIGAATVYCAGLLARDLFAAGAAPVAAVITALYPYYVVHDTALQETSLFTLLALLAVRSAVLARRTDAAARSLASGALLAAVVLTRANLAPFAALVPFCLAVPGRGEPWPSWQRVRTGLICAATVVLLLSPWIGRSYWLTGTPTLTTQTGFFLWLGNNPSTFSRYPHDSIDRSQEVALAQLSPADEAELAALTANEASYDAWFWRKGVGYIARHPVETIVNGLYKVAAVFCWLPSPRQGVWPNLVMAGSFGPIMLLGLAGMWLTRGDWREHLVIYAQFAAFCVVTAVFFGHTSYRAYLDVYWIVFAAETIRRLAARMSRFAQYPAFS